MRLALHNVRTYSDAQLDIPEPGFAVLVGQSDSGKSNIVRAIRKLLYNDGANKTFRQKGSSEPATVSLTADITVDRGVSNSGNLYHLNGTEYDAARTVPDEVVEALRCQPLRVGDREWRLNLRMQHDPKFLVGDTPGQRAKALMVLAEFDIFDKAVASVKKRVTALTAVVDSKKGELVEAEARLNNLPSAEALRAVHSRLSGLNDRVYETEHLLWVVDEEFTKLTTADSELKVVGDQLEKLTKLQKQIQSDVDALTVVSSRLLDVAERLESIESDGTEYQRVTAQLVAIGRADAEVVCKLPEAVRLNARCSQIQVCLNDLDCTLLSTSENRALTTVPRLLDTVRKMLDDAWRQYGDLDETEDALDRFDQAQGVLARIDPDVQKAEQTQQAILSERVRYIASIGVCPVCKQSTKGLAG